MSPLLCLLPLVLWATVAQTEVVTTDQAPYAASVLSISDAAVELEIGNNSRPSNGRSGKLSFSPAPRQIGWSLFAQRMHLRSWKGSYRRSTPTPLVSTSAVK